MSQAPELQDRIILHPCFISLEDTPAAKKAKEKALRSLLSGKQRGGKIDFPPGLASAKEILVVGLGTRITEEIDAANNRLMLAMQNRQFVDISIIIPCGNLKQSPTKIKNVCFDISALPLSKEYGDDGLVWKLKVASASMPIYLDKHGKAIPKEF